ncbi:MAG TPA: CpsB/CapC family capsule biosynthesis tyrosine phosphatase [Dehalococcoidia bacterium]|nr:CpsB/CapC family capsule biosynthesis tyrosine phosphatase [Dehalococcoidia bacterium]
MFDLHCHLLPGLDDGARSLDEALTMARLARADGIRAIVATPHADQWDGGSSLAAAWRAINQLGGAFARQGLDLRLLPGVEVQIMDGLARDLDAGRAFPLAESRYVLLHLPSDQDAGALDRAWEVLDQRGLRPILAGPERHPHLQRDARPIERWAARGGLIQIGAASLLAEPGDRALAAAEDFLRRRLAHLIASGGHAPTGDRPPCLSAAVDRAAALIGGEAARDLVTLTPLTILADGDVPVVPFLPAERPWWKRW